MVIAKDSDCLALAGLLYVAREGDFALVITNN
jgi:hypothetical protein